MAEHLADDQNMTLKVLNLAGNKISDTGAKAMGKFVAVNLVLEELCLDSNQIGIEGRPLCSHHNDVQRDMMMLSRHRCGCHRLGSITFMYESE